MRTLDTVLCCLHSRSQPRYPRFQSCPMCRMEAPRETIIVEAAVNYFSKPEFQELFIDIERGIQMGIDNRRADIVLLDKAENFIAIIECKRTGVVTYGPKQLKAYLCATDTQLGIFANSTDPNDWEFYENLRRNQFKKLTRNQFEKETLLQRSIESMREERHKLEVEIERFKQNNEKLIERNRTETKTHGYLEQKVNQLKAEKTELENEVEKFEKKKSKIQSTNLQISRSWQYIAGVLSVALCICIAILAVLVNKQTKIASESKELINKNQALQKRLTENPLPLMVDTTKSEKENETLQRENKILQRDVDKIHLEKDKLQKQLREKNTQIATLNSKVVRLEEELRKKNGKLPTPKPPDKPDAININTASVEELQTLPSIGPKKAQDIIEYREKHGTFNSVDDITKVYGIGTTTLENLRPLIRIE